jgi:hypothetical protein
MAKRKAPPFRFTKKSKALVSGRLKAGCKVIRTPSGTRYLCKTGR